MAKFEFFTLITSYYNNISTCINTVIKNNFEHYTRHFKINKSNEYLQNNMEHIILCQKDVR